jgi:phage terminase large subunit GpA-like protein
VSKFNTDKTAIDYFFDRFLSKIYAALKPPPNLKVSDWADRFRKLSAESSAEAGQWFTARAEYQREIMNSANDPKIKQVVMMSSAQVGKTEMINNVIGYFIEQNPRPLLLLQPTLEMAKTWSKDRLSKMLRDTPCLKDKVKDARARDSGNTVFHKEFPGGHITMAGANSPASLASRPIAKVFCDEVDRYPASAGSEGDPVNLAKKRMTTFHDSQIWLMSTPTIKDVSRIERAFKASDMRFYFVKCVFCEHPQKLQWSQVRWKEGEPNTAEYVCESCEKPWKEGERHRAIRKGEWIAEEEFKGIAGFFINELYSPWSSLRDIVESFLEAKKSPELLQTFINTSLGETWEEKGEGVDTEGLISRVEDWGSTHSSDILIITIGADVQKDRIEFEVVGWGVGEESWSLDYQILKGDPNGMEIWNRLQHYIDTTTFNLHEGTTLTIGGVCIDSGGMHTEYVYNFCRGKAVRRIFPVKGSSVFDAPIAPLSPSRTKTNLRLYQVGVNKAKELIYSRFGISDFGNGYCHFPKGRELDYFKQLTAETLVTQFKAGVPFRRWKITKGKRNEALDCRVYALACLKILDTNGRYLEFLLNERQKKQQKGEKPLLKGNNFPLARKKIKNNWITGQ